MKKFLLTYIFPRFPTIPPALPTKQESISNPRATFATGNDLHEPEMFFKNEHQFTRTGNDVESTPDIYAQEKNTRKNDMEHLKNITKFNKMKESFQIVARLRKAYQNHSPPLQPEMFYTNWKCFSGTNINPHELETN